MDRAEVYLDSEDLENPDEEALGAAVYLEEAVSGERDDLEPLVDYIARSTDFDFESFVEYKSEMGNEYSHFPGEVSGVLDEMSHAMRRNEAVGTIYQALYEEAVGERDSATSAIGSIIDDVSGRDTESGWPDGINIRGRRRRTGTENFMSPVFNFGHMDEVPSRGFMSPTYNFGSLGREEDAKQSWGDYEWGGWSQIREPEVESPSELFRGSRGSGFGNTIIYNPQFVSNGHSTGSRERHESRDFFQGMDMPWGPNAS